MWRWRLASSTSFNPRTHGGCDDVGEIEPKPANMFQSTHPRGVRLRTICGLRFTITFQSTHPRGVRPKEGRVRGKASPRFNPRTHGGCDYAYRAIELGLEVFQSTHPRGVRQRFGLCLSVSILFQSTHPRGVRLSTSCPCLNWMAFQSTHPRGVRLAHLVGFQIFVGVSIHAPTGGATRERLCSSSQ